MKTTKMFRVSIGTLNGIHNPAIICLYSLQDLIGFPEVIKDNTKVKLTVSNNRMKRKSFQYYGMIKLKLRVSTGSYWAISKGYDYPLIDITSNMIAKTFGKWSYHFLYIGVDIL